MPQSAPFTVNLELALSGKGSPPAGAYDQALAKSAGCTNCHAVDTKKVGPAFKEVAAKYKGKADAEKTLTAKLSKGEGHPPVKASPADITSLVKWVLSQ